ncbi:MAG: hypothetical protein K2I99_01150 [Bacteroidaceae bacterium]|nr:hypothetical protein [Bacteroidaceae bacterium]
MYRSLLRHQAEERQAHEKVGNVEFGRGRLGQGGGVKLALCGLKGKKMP